jgi:hypothetical protein
MSLKPVFKQPCDWVGDYLVFKLDEKSLIHSIRRNTYVWEVRRGDAETILLGHITWGNGFSKYVFAMGGKGVYLDSLWMTDIKQFAESQTVGYYSRASRGKAGVVE